MLKQKIVSGSSLQGLGAKLLLLLQGGQGSANPATVQHIGRVLAGDRVQNVENLDTVQNGVKMILFLHQILNKLRALEKK